ncbi:hypothetical protein [Streptomyces sp. NPDC056491]|uniref:hypothetical protein n=1 Tax=Streptomyces sp. NPDC056491 TaxID=3345837 RepID=UPI00368CD2DB
MAKKRDTGEGQEYADAEAEAVAQAVADAYDAWGADNEAEPTRADVRAKVEWAGHVMPANDGKRRTRVELSPEKMKKVRKIVEKVKKATAKKEAAKPSARYKAKSPRARWNELAKSPRGRAAAKSVGLSPSAKTAKRWASGGAPSKAYAAKISEAYDALRNWNVREAGEASAAASKEAADAMTEAMKDRYGVNIRFRDIDHMDFE